MRLTLLYVILWIYCEHIVNNIVNIVNILTNSFKLFLLKVIFIKALAKKLVCLNERTQVWVHYLGL